MSDSTSEEYELVLRKGKKRRIEHAHPTLHKEADAAAVQLQDLNDDCLVHIFSFLQGTGNHVLPPPTPPSQDLT